MPVSPLKMAGRATAYGHVSDMSWRCHGKLQEGNLLPASDHDSPVSTWKSVYSARKKVP